MWEKWRWNLQKKYSQELKHPLGVQTRDHGILGKDHFSEGDHDDDNEHNDPAGHDDDDGDDDDHGSDEKVLMMANIEKDSDSSDQTEDDTCFLASKMQHFWGFNINPNNSWLNHIEPLFLMGFIHGKTPHQFIVKTPQLMVKPCI